MENAYTQPDVVAGMGRLLDDYLQVDAEKDFVVVAYTPDSRDAAALCIAGLKARNVQNSAVGMRPLIDYEFAARLQNHVDAAAGRTRLHVLTLERDTMSHFGPLEAVLKSRPSESCMITRIISASPEFFSMGLHRTPQHLSARNATLLHLLRQSDSMRITTPAGTDLEVTLDEKRFDWISNRGIWRKGAFTILPPGEIATFPAEINGVLVADGAINCNIITRLDVRLGQTPATITIDESRAVDFKCDNRELLELLSLCFARKNGPRVGELGFGTNDGISQFIPANSHLNERYPGVHIGFGQHNQPLGAAGYDEDVHLDMITNDAVVQPAGLAHIQMSDLPHLNVKHPDDVRDEDITGDCCGFGYGQLGVQRELRMIE